MQTGTEANNADLLKGLTPEAIIETSTQVVYPVTSVYFSTSATNPATLLGFGTWTLSGTGAILGTTVHMWERTA